MKGDIIMTEEIRPFLDRRSGTDRGKAYRPGFFSRGGIEKRHCSERRRTDERREGWVRVGKWSSVQLNGLKIGKFLKQRSSKASFKTGS
jgi:hypothetical protein